MIHITFEEKVAAMFANLQLPNARFTPYLFSDCCNEVRAAIYQKHKAENVDFIYCNTFNSPTQLFEYLRVNANANKVFEGDLLSKRKEYIDVLIGAICSNPSTVEPWKVSYDTESFVFRGSILVLSVLTKEELKAKANLKYILRDIKVI